MLKANTFLSKNIFLTPFSSGLGFCVNLGSAIGWGIDIYKSVDVTLMSVITNIWFITFIISIIVTSVLIRMRQQIKRIIELEKNDIALTTENKFIREQNQKLELEHKTFEEYINNMLNDIERLKNANEIPFFKGKYSMNLTHIQDNISKLINNNLKITLMSVHNIIANSSSQRRDSEALMHIEGVTMEDSSFFRFMLTGESNTEASKMNVKAKDILLNCNMHIEIAEHGYNGTVKEFVLYYNDVKKKGETFCFEISWKWPKMLDIKEDFIAGSNFLSKNVGKLRLSLLRNRDQKFKTVAIYKYSVYMKTPEPITIVNIDPAKSIFTYEINNPSDNTEYLMYYNDEN